MKTVMTLLVLLAGFALGFVCAGLITRVPTDVLTCSRISVLERAIKDHCLRCGRMPGSLDDLPLAGREHCRQNPWGAKISYVVTNGTVVVLRTYGRGGPDAEVVQTFERRFKCDFPPNAK